MMTFNMVKQYVTSITNDAYSGNSALQSVFQSGTNWQFQFYTYTENLSGWSNDWQFAKKFVANPGSWANNRVNRLRRLELVGGDAQDGAAAQERAGKEENGKTKNAGTESHAAGSTGG